MYVNRLTSVFYRGTTYTCNVCNKSFRKFKSKGAVRIRKNAKCPYCSSLERTRLLLFYLQNETNIFTQKKSLLHFAPEEGLYRLFKQTPTLHYVNGDINANYADEQIDITRIPYPDASFDYIICSHVLGYIPDELLAVKEMFRVLKPDGIALILTLVNKNAPSTYESPDVHTVKERLQHYTEPDVLRLHGTDIYDRIAKGGFIVEQIDYVSTFSEEIQRRYSLGNGERETIFKCTKR